jgi:hypothetical protein
MRTPVLRPSEAARQGDMERRIAALEQALARVSAPVQQRPGSTTNMVKQSAHGFAVKDVLRHNGTSWTKAQADTAANAVVGGIVVAVLSPDVFVMATAGYVAGLTGLTAGSVHYLSAATAGALTTTAPDLCVAVLVADSTTSGALAVIAHPGPGVVLGTGHRTASATVGSLDIAISTDGDAIRISDAENGIAFYDRSVSTTVPLIVIAVGHASLNATGRALSVREIDVCDAGVAKKMLVLASAPY